MTAEADARRIGVLVENLSRGFSPPLAADFTWRGKPCEPEDFAKKLQAMSAMELAILETRVVSSGATLEIGGLLEGYCGLTPREGDRLAVVTVQFQEHIISWGLLVQESGVLRAWFDPSALLQLIAP